MTPKITVHLWFDKDAAQAADFYISVFRKGSKVVERNTISGTPSGKVEIVTADILDQRFTLIGAGPLFKFNPSVSFLVACRTAREVDDLWGSLSKDGRVLMELGAYPFSRRYGWTEDKYGLSWQIMLSGDRVAAQEITPTLLFTGEVCGKAEEAVNFYASVFKDSRVGDLLRYGEGEEPERAGSIKHADFTLEGREFAAMESAQAHDFSFNEAVSFMVHCGTQEEIDHYWGKLSAVPQAERCGWLKDKYGVSWQVVPDLLDEMMRSKDGRRRARVTRAFLKMGKFDIRALKKAYAGGATRPRSGKSSPARVKPRLVRGWASRRTAAVRPRRSAGKGGRR